MLYCHISEKDETPLLEIREDICKLLEEEHGLLVLFLDTGLADLLDMIHPIERELSRADVKKEKLLLKTDYRKRSQSLRESEALGKSLENSFGPCLRVLTALDLIDVFGEMMGVGELKKFLMGTKGEIRYDTPKFIEAIVRLRMIGSRVPLLRLDHDVLIPATGESFNKDTLTLAILKICNAVAEHHNSTQILATILSANYKSPDANEKDVMAWNRGFATRILPSLLLPEDNVAQEYLQNKTSKNWGTELQSHFRPEFTKKFFHDLWQWGAPKTAIISGALLYMNDAVVLNVPPFSNFSQRVMWIDDHLRYVLHREMGDLCRQTKIESKTGERLHVFYEKVQISKYRATENFLLYTVQTYLPSLIWGSFVDYWLCPDPILKRREEEVPLDHKENWKTRRDNGCPGILATAVLDARAGCPPDEAKLRRKLKAAANDRLKVLCEIWGDLKDEKCHSIASAWVHGQFTDSLKTALKTASPIVSLNLPDRVEDFQNNLETGFNALLDDTCQYIKWVSEWPRVVSVIRSVPTGELRSDLGWTK